MSQLVAIHDVKQHDIEYGEAVKVALKQLGAPYCIIAALSIVTLLITIAIFLIDQAKTIKAGKNMEIVMGAASIVFTLAAFGAVAYARKTDRIQLLQMNSAYTESKESKDQNFIDRQRALLGPRRENLKNEQT